MILRIIFEYSALTFGTISVIAYIPQIRNLLKEKNSVGNSLMAWCLWFVCDIPPLIYAVYIKDLVFTIIYFLNIVFLLCTITLILKYRKK